MAVASELAAHWMHYCTGVNPAIRLTAFALGSLLVACGDRHSARAENADTSRAAPAEGLAPNAASTPGAGDTDEPGKLSGAKPPSPPPASTTSRGTSDSAILLQLATQPKSRSMADSISLVAAIRAGLKSAGWPVSTAPRLSGSILPTRRIVAFYGNPLSKRMGILGEIPYDQMLAKLDTFVGKWRTADPNIPVQPALHLIVSVAQPQPGKDGLYRQRSDPDLIEKIYGMAHARGALTILDLQVGKSTIDSELPIILPFLQRPDVHLGLDPEFSMHHNREGRIPGEKIGAMDADDVNKVIATLANLVTTYHLPPKVLIVHRFTTNMLQRASTIQLDPRVQVVINMDGWGQPWLKFDTYKKCEVDEPVQFTGFKLFFHNDTRKGDALLDPLEVLALRPRPIYIQYQ
jgi:hypothetical protein